MGVTANLMSQFHVLSTYELPAEDKIMSRDGNNQIIADSCEIKLYFSTFYGDSLAQMKLTTHELAKPIEEAKYLLYRFQPKDKRICPSRWYKGESNIYIIRPNFIK